MKNFKKRINIFFNIFDYQSYENKFDFEKFKSIESILTYSSKDIEIGLNELKVNGKSIYKITDCWDINKLSQYLYKVDAYNNSSLNEEEMNNKLDILQALYILDERCFGDDEVFYPDFYNHIFEYISNDYDYIINNIDYILDIYNSHNNDDIEAKLMYNEEYDFFYNEYFDKYFKSIQAKEDVNINSENSHIDFIKEYLKISKDIIK